MQLSVKYEQKPVGTNYVESYLLTYYDIYVWNVYFYILFSWCPCDSISALAAVLWPSLRKSGWQAGIFTDQPAIMFYCSWFRDGPQFFRWLRCPKKRHIAAFFSLSPNKRGWDINRLEEKQLFSARGCWVLLPCTRSLLEGSFVWGWILRLIACIGVVVKLSRGDLSSWCQGWLCLQSVLHKNRTLVCESTDG